MGLVRRCITSMDNAFTLFKLLPKTFSAPSGGITSVDPLSLFLAIIAGGVTGTLINYLSDVLPLTRRLTQPLCPECNQPYSIKDYFFARKCSNCDRRRPTRSIIVLIGVILCSVLLQFFPFAYLSFWATLPIMIFLVAILVIDIEHRLVLIEMSLVGILLFLIYGVILRGFSRTLLGGLGGLLIMLAFYFLGILFSKIVGKLRGHQINEVAFGFGDVCAGTFLGLLAGWPGIVGAIIIALISFGAFSFFFIIALLLSKRYRAFANALPFTPFLILGTILIFYF